MTQVLSPCGFKYEELSHNFKISTLTQPNILSKDLILLIVEYWCDGILVECKCVCGLPMFKSDNICIVCDAKLRYKGNFDQYIERCAYKTLFLFHKHKATVSPLPYSGSMFIQYTTLVGHGTNVIIKDNYICWYGSNILYIKSSDIQSYKDHHIVPYEYCTKYSNKVMVMRNKWLLTKDESDIWNKHEANHLSEIVNTTYI